MTDLEQSALAVYFANCQGIKSDPLPMLRKILALGEGDRRDAEKWRYAGFACNAEGVADLKRRADAAEAALDAAIDAAMTPTRPESV